MIILSPYAKPLRNGEFNHPKNYPHWNKLIPLLKTLNLPLIQVGGAGLELPLEGVENQRRNLSLNDLASMINECVTWISVDSFFQHYSWHLKKRGVVLWGQSDPVIFGHPENVNLLKDRKYLRQKQFWLWEQTTYQPEAFVEAEEVFVAIKTLMQE